ncbi:hypothetical protein D3C79_771920 [compost metagenome]
MAGIATMAHGRAEVSRTDEHAIDAFDGDDLIQPGQALKVLDLYQQAHLFIGLVEVAGYAVPARSAGQGAAHTTYAAGRVVDGADQLAGLFSTLDHGHQQSLGADVEELLDQCCIADHRPNDGLRGIGRHRLQLAKQAAQVIGCVFTIDQ